MASIFISYRRSDTGGHAQSLFHRLSMWWDDDELFFDLASFDIGQALRRDNTWRDGAGQVGSRGHWPGLGGKSEAKSWASHVIDAVREEVGNVLTQDANG